MGSIDAFPDLSARSAVTLGYAEATSNQALSTADTDLNGLSVVVTVPAGRRLRITAQCFIRTAGAATMGALRIKEDGVIRQLTQHDTTSSSAGETHNALVVCTPSAGTHTYKLSANVYAGTGSMDANVLYPAFILVEDITGMAMPYSPLSQPVGRIAYSESVTDSGAIADLGIVPNISANVAVPSGRVLKVTVHAQVHTTAAAGWIAYVRMDGVVIGRAGLYMTDAAEYTVIDGSHIVSPAAGAHTFDVQVDLFSGSGTTDWNGNPQFPYWIMVEDITPTPAPAATAPSSTIGYVENFAHSQNVTTLRTAMTGGAVTVTVPAGRRLLITAKCHLSSTVAGDRIEMAICEGATVLNASYYVVAIASAGEDVWVSHVLTPSAGTHTYTLTGGRQSGTGTVTVFSVAGITSNYILVEDISSVSILPTAIVPGNLVVTSTTRPVSPSVGTVIFETDTGKVWVWNGTDWVPPLNLAQGVLALRDDSNGGSTYALSFGTTETILWTTPAIKTYAGRRYRISGYATFTAGGASNFIIWRMRRGTTTGGTQTGWQKIARGAYSGFFSMEDVPGAQAAQQWVITFATDTSVGDLFGPSLITLEDVGAA